MEDNQKNTCILLGENIGDLAYVTKEEIVKNLRLFNIEPVGFLLEPEVYIYREEELKKFIEAKKQIEEKLYGTEK